MELSAKQHWANGHHFQALLYEQGEGAGKGHRPQMFPRWGVHGSTKHVPFQEILLPTVIMWQVQWQYQDFSGFCHLLSCLAMNHSTDFLARSKVLIDWEKGSTVLSAKIAEKLKPQSISEWQLTGSINLIKARFSGNKFHISPEYQATIGYH